jgi:CheY-like chemotaxis protein
MAEQIKILIVDDHQLLADCLADSFKIFGYETQRVLSGLEAITIIQEQSFDIVLMDIRMPSINGVETLKEIKKYSPHTEVILMTGYAASELIEEGLKAGAYMCLQKPFGPVDVLEVIKEITKKKVKT